MVKINTNKYVEIIINEFLIKISKSGMALTLAGNNIFEKGNSRRLGKNQLKSSTLQ